MNEKTEEKRRLSNTLQLSVASLIPHQNGRGTISQGKKGQISAAFRVFPGFFKENINGLDWMSLVSRPTEYQKPHDLCASQMFSYFEIRSFTKYPPGLV